MSHVYNLVFEPVNIVDFHYLPCLRSFPRSKHSVSSQFDLVVHVQETPTQSMEKNQHFLNEKKRTYPRKTIESHYINMAECLRISGCYGKDCMERGGGKIVGTIISQVLRKSTTVGARNIDRDWVFNTKTKCLVKLVKKLKNFNRFIQYKHLVFLWI